MQIIFSIQLFQGGTQCLSVHPHQEEKLEKLRRSTVKKLIKSVGVKEVTVGFDLCRKIFLSVENVSLLLLLLSAPQPMCSLSGD